LSNKLNDSNQTLRNKPSEHGLSEQKSGYYGTRDAWRALLYLHFFTNTMFVVLRAPKMSKDQLI
jgi:hypothetical protein